MPSTPLAIGKLIGRTLEMYRTHFGIFLRTTAIFYIPLAALAFFVARGMFGDTVFLIVFLPVQAVANLAIISHCVESLHGRPLAIRTAIKNSLRRLLVYFGMVAAGIAVLAGISVVLAVPVTITLLATDFPFTVFRDAFTSSIPPDDIDAQARQIESVMSRRRPLFYRFHLYGSSLVDVRHRDHGGGNRTHRVPAPKLGSEQKLCPTDGWLSPALVCNLRSDYGSAQCVPGIWIA
ncbi:MAG: hypothetical protein OXO50_02075 [Caldilineaceae bacterium]|nr:hypothetical protein [Caldilineaceae bacterium]